MSMTISARTRATSLVISILLWTPLANAASAQPNQEETQHLDSTAPLTLANAVALALERNPTLATFSWDMRAAEARQIQAELRPNPELNFDVEDLRIGSRSTTRTSRSTVGWSATGLTAQTERETERSAGNGFSDAQYTASLSQLVELGGKRAARMRLAARDRDVTAWDYEVARAEVLKDVNQAFVRVLAAQERVSLDNELVELAEEVAKTVSARVDAGRVSPLEATRAETALSVARVQGRQSKATLASARAGLAALWGGKDALFERADGALDHTRDIPAFDELVTRAAESPDLARWNAELEKRRTAIAVEKARSVPDLTIRAGFRATGLPDTEVRGFGAGSEGFSSTRAKSRSDSDWDNSVVLGFSVPLPLFNRNQGSIKEAGYLAAKAEDERRAADVRMHARLTQNYQGLAASLAAIASLKGGILPSATQTFASINEAYRQGKFGYLDVLDAQRTLFEARRQYLDALVSYHENASEIERVIGESLWNTGESAPNPLEEK